MGRGLFLEVLSFKAVVEEVGVPWAEVFGDCELPEPTNVELDVDPGEAVPDAESFLLFDLLFESLARESWSCCISQTIS